MLDVDTLHISFAMFQAGMALVQICNLGPHLLLHASAYLSAACFMQFQSLISLRPLLYNTGNFPALKSQLRQCVHWDLGSWTAPGALLPTQFIP